MRREKGITLVALVITIIVLIILAGVTIRAVMNGGLITNAKGAKEEWEIGKTDEEGKLGSLLEKLEGKKVTSEKGSIVLENASGENLKNYRIYGKSEQGNLPSEYQQVEYIESTGTQYINTGINPSSKTKFEIKAEFPDAENLGIYQAMGWGAAGSNEAFFIAIDTRYPDEDFYGVRLAVSDNYESISTGFVDVSKPMFISISNGNQSINDVTYGTNTITRTGQSLYLFALHNGWNTIDNYTHSKLYFSKIYENDRLVRNLIPCYRKSDNVIGLYDLVENKFYTNSGTGTFSKGSDCPTPEVPLEVEIKSVGDFDEAAEQYKIPVTVTSKNLLKPTKVAAGAMRLTQSMVIKNDYGTTLDSMDLSDNTVTVTQTPNTNYDAYSYPNGYFCIVVNNLIVGKKYNLSFDIDIHENPLNATYMTICPGGLVKSTTSKIESLKQRLYSTFEYAVYPHAETHPYIEIRNSGVSFTASNFMITEVDEDTEFEPYVEPITTNIYLDEPLRSIGDKADYIDFKEQKVVRYIKEENGVLSELEQAKEEKITLPNIKTFEGTTNITINTTIQPSKIEVNY